MSNTKRITITLNKDLHKVLNEMADKQERSISQQIAFLIKKGMK